MYGFSDSFFGSTFDKYQEHKWFISILSIMHILCIKLTQTFLHPEKKQMINLRLLLHMPITIEWGGGEIIIANVKEMQIWRTVFDGKLHAACAWSIKAFVSFSKCQLATFFRDSQCRCVRQNLAYSVWISSKATNPT